MMLSLHNSNTLISPEDLFQSSASMKLLSIWKYLDNVPMNQHSSRAQAPSNLVCSRQHTPCPTGCMEISDCPNGMSCGYYYNHGYVVAAIYQRYHCSCRCQNIPSTSINDDPTIREGIISLYNTTNPDGWYHDSNWGTDATYCSFFGINCDKDLHFISINIAKNNLLGSIPSDFFMAMSTSTEIQFNDNILEGPILSDLGSLVSLVQVVLHDNYFTGTFIIGSFFISLLLYRSHLTFTAALVGNHHNKGIIIFEISLDFSKKITRNSFIF